MCAPTHSLAPEHDAAPLPAGQLAAVGPGDLPEAVVRVVALASGEGDEPGGGACRVGLAQAVAEYQGADAAALQGGADGDAREVPGVPAAGVGVDDVGPNGALHLAEQGAGGVLVQVGDRGEPVAQGEVGADDAGYPGDCVLYHGRVNNDRSVSPSTHPPCRPPSSHDIFFGSIPARIRDSERGFIFLQGDSQRW